MKKSSIIFLAIAVLSLTSCDEFLNQEPMSSLSPDQYLSSEDNIGSYAINLYSMLPDHNKCETQFGVFGWDKDTDDMAYANPGTIYADGVDKVPQTGGDYSFKSIYQCNYFLSIVLPKLASGEITGSQENLNQYVGEVYFFRAYSYFEKLKKVGDYPIVTTTLPDDLEILTTASKRAPRNEVARFIISDLDKAIDLLSNNPNGGTNRLSKDVARLFKSRVALYEGTWLKNFKGTAFVPCGPDWPGATKDYNANYQYPTGNIDNEIQYFLGICMAESKIVADKYALTTCTGNFKNTTEDGSNPYMVMFGDSDMSKYREILLWKQAKFGVAGTHHSVEFLSAGNCGFGLTKGLIDSFVMTDGLPIYASSSYPGDADLKKITDGRDYRASLFIKRPGDKNTHDNGNYNPQSFPIEPYPNLLQATTSLKYTTGYTMRKGLNFSSVYSLGSESGLIIFRAAECYMNYVEACYEKTGALDTDAQKYWNAIRKRAGLPEYGVTVAATDVAKEAAGDWGAYTAGKLVDATLYCIRRDRRCEFFGENFRNADIRRWRAMDQMKTTPWHVLGINLWEKNANLEEFKAAQSDRLIEGKTVSEKSFSKYFAPYHIFSNNMAYNGYTWKLAHYLSPIAIQHFIITGNGNPSSSPLYQNPGWGIEANESAQY